MTKRTLEPGMSLSQSGMTLKGKPKEVMRMLNDLTDTHGEDATIKDIYANTMQAILHPLVPVDADIKDGT